MNQQCKVCGEPAAGFHFGAFTCEGCKSFFGRTYNNLSSISECKNNRDCIINKKNRTSCKACRLRKCLLVGMSKSGSRFGRRSNWFKIHCLLQEQQQQQQQQQQHHHHNHNHHHQQQQQQQHQSDERERKNSSDTKLTEPTESIGHSDTSTTPSTNRIHDTAANFLFSTSMALALKAQRKRKKSSSDSGASSTTDENRPRSRCYSPTTQQHLFLNGQKNFHFSNNRFFSTTSTITSQLLSQYGVCMMTPPAASPATTTISPQSATSISLYVQNEPIDLSIKSNR